MAAGRGQHQRFRLLPTTGTGCTCRSGRGAFRLPREQRRWEQEPDRETRYGFRTITTPTPAELWLTVEDLIPRIGNCIADVAYVWQKADVEYPRAQRLAQEGAKAFWEPLKNS